MLLPKLLREKLPDLSIGFFLHTPFPSYDIFRTLPTAWRREILEGILGADLIGFHTIDYTQHFLRCILRILGYEHTFGQVLIDGERTIKIDTVPMGVDYCEIRDASKSDDIQEEGRGLRERLGNRKIILSQDRLDYTKGIKNRLEAYSIFLERHPQWQRKVVLVLSVVPSRLGAEQYEQMKEEIDKLVGGINGKFGTIDWTPIVYRYRFLPYNQLLSLFAISDVALVTPLRDGMNLVAKEYIASKTDQEKFSANLLDAPTREKMMRDYDTSPSSILFLDYDGTLSPFKARPETAVPEKTLLSVLNALSEDPRNNLVIISGRNRSLLQDWFGALDLGIVAEHGAWIKQKGKDWVPTIKVESNWKEKVRPTLRGYEDRLPGSFLEEKEFSLVWHFRAADPELAYVRSKELADELSYFTENTELQVLQGSKSIEVRNVGINKGMAAKLLLSETAFDFVLAMGDDWADEDLFEAIPDEAYSIKVGLSKSYAKFNLRNHREVIQLLTDLYRTGKS